MNKTDALIIGAGPTGLFTAHQLKLIGLDCEVVDNLDKKVAREVAMIAKIIILLVIIFNSKQKSYGSCR